MAIQAELIRQGKTKEHESLRQFFKKIQEAAFDGQRGSNEYALDRLALIQAMATTAIHKLED